MARRSSREGSVHQLGERWVAAIELPPTPTGRRVRRRRFAKTKTEALRLLREMRQDMERNGAVADNRRTVAEAIQSFWDTRQGANRRDDTFERDRWMLDMIQEGLGRSRVGSLSVGDCDAFLVQIATGIERADRSRRQPLVREHVSRTRSMLRRVLKNEVRLGYAVRNVAELAEMPATGAQSRAHVILSPAELLRLLTAAKGVMVAFTELCGRNGLRPQEARAIEWSAVDLDEGTLNVGPQMDRSGIIVGPKTPRAPRTIALAPETVGALTRWKQEQHAIRTAAGTHWDDTYDLVITTRVGTTIAGGNARRSLRKLASKVGINASITPYDLRHTAITLQSKLAYSDWELADWAGTSERMINEVYRHRTDRIVRVRPLDLKPEAS
jgi:integrase